MTPSPLVIARVEVFEGGDFVLSSYRDVEDASTTMQIFFAENGTDGGEMRAAAERAKKIFMTQITTMV